MGRNRRTIVVAVGAILVVLAGVFAALYILGGRGPGNGGILERLNNGIAAITSGLSPAKVAGAEEFVFRRLDIDTTKSTAEACMVFTRDLDASGRTHYEDYFTITPKVRVAAHVVGPRLCLSGLDFNTTYTVTLKTGLPSVSGEKLSEDETVPVELRDKPSLVRFNGGIILPRDNAEGVPVTTVNISKLKLKVIRVGDRLLSQIESSVVDETSLYTWKDSDLETNQGKLVFEGTMDVAMVKNDTVVTLIPINQILKNKEPGAYVLIAKDAAQKDSDSENDYENSSIAAQWVIDSDIALTTFKGASGMSVFARSYATARPLSGVKLNLIARDNNLLATVSTDSHGRADFDAGLFRATGGDEPVVVMVYSGDDFSFSDLRRSAFDLSDRGVSGRASPGPVDGFLYTERGVYRPGETVQAVAMLRDRVGAQITAPLTLVATRPDGMEVARATIAGSTLAAGSTAWSLPLSRTAPHGRWQIAAYIDPKADPVGRVQFDVADFVPQRLKVVLTAEEPQLHPNMTFHVKAESRFLYGAPANGLSADGTARIAADPAPFPAYLDWQFGRVDDSFADVKIDLNVPTSDEQGVAEATGEIGDLADTTLPLKADVTISVHEPGGRTTDKNISVPVRTRDLMIGIRPLFQFGSVAENAPAGFEVIAVDATGKRVALQDLTYSWVREDATYQWFEDNGQWKFQSATRDRLITSGVVSVGHDAPARLSQAMPWGTYRLTITDPRTRAASSYRFWSGWAASSAGDRPDRIPVAADKPAYRIGETAHVRIKPQADGKALVVVAGDKVFSSQLVDAPASGATVDVPVGGDWGAGAYVLVTDYRPLNQATGREPVRSIGVTWLGVDNSARTLSVAIGGAQKILPRQRIFLPVTIKGLGGESAFLTVAAVDEGILQLTDFKSPDPVGYFFGKRRLGVEMRDDYGRLIKSEKAPLGALTEGGDNFGGRPLAVVPIKTVALFSGLVKVGANGVANVPLDVPDFNGELRLMAVVWTSDKLGEAARPLTVRDPVVAEIVLPRFLAPGDHALAALNMDNVEGAAGDYVATVRTSGPLGLAGGVPQTVIHQRLNRSQRVLVPVVLEAKDIGIANVALSVTGPGFAVSRSWPIELRAPQLDVAREEVEPLAANATYTANGQLVTGLVGSTVNVGLAVTAAHGYSNVAGLIKWLDKYPYGCIEQTTSRAMPLLVFNDLSDLAGLPKDQALRPRLQDSIDSVLDMQNFAGNFGMWAPGSDADPWISAYALDFLYQAKARGYVVPNDALRRGAGWLRQTSTSDSFDDATRAYAFYLLARAGELNLSDLRYFSDTRGPEWNSAMAAALTGAAAAEAGDRSRAAYGFSRARDLLFKGKANAYPSADYGSLLRDLAGTTALAAESNEAELIPALLHKSDEVDMRLNWTTTQEKAWMLRAAYELTREKMPLRVLVNNRPAVLRAGAVRLAPGLAELNRGITFVNKGDGTVWRTTSVEGTPSAPLPAESSNVTIEKAIFTMSGQAADVANLHQNDRVLVELSGRLPNYFYRQMGLIDLLPAGLEVELPLSGDDGKVYGWLDPLTTTTMGDARDDRFVAAFTVGSEYVDTSENAKKNPPPLPTFHVAYIARATTTGIYVLPAGVVEDMYAPSVHARTSVGSLTVK